MADIATHAYIARCPTCNAVPFATIDNPDHRKRVANQLAHEIRRYGSIIERIPIDDLRKGVVNISKCTCAKEALP